MRTLQAAAKFTQFNNNSTPSISVDMNIASITRVSEGVYTVTFDNTSTFTLSTSIVSVTGHGRAGDNNSQNLGDDEFTGNWGVLVDSSNIKINSKDNNTDGNADFEVCYFMVFGR
jgi:hypothetical protein